MSPITDPRTAAHRAIVTVLERKQPLDPLLAKMTEGFEGRDRAFTRQLAATVFRRFGHLTLALRHLLEKPLPREAKETEAILRLGLAQILWLDVPDHAAVSTSMTLASRSRHPKERALKGLVNAILRRAAREADELRAMLAAQPLGLIPRWYRDRLVAAYGETAAHIAQAVTTVPPLDLTLRPGATAPEGSAPLFPGHARLQEYDAIPGLPGFASGDWWVQDIAASLPAQLLPVTDGARVLDMCAAPGGKTLQLAAMGAQVTALDISDSRLRQIAENLTRTSLSAKLIAADARTFKDGAPYDSILLDAPCSATGTWRRHPEGLWIRNDKSITGMLPVQAALLDQAFKLLKPGGTLVYATCSLEPEEGEAQIAKFLARTPGASLTPIRADELDGHADWISADGYLRTLPHFFADQGGMDGFFAARITRRSDP